MTATVQDWHRGRDLMQMKQNFALESAGFLKTAAGGKSILKLTSTAWQPTTMSKTFLIILGHLLQTCGCPASIHLPLCPGNIKAGCAAASAPVSVRLCQAAAVCVC